jgi:putative ABC transport system permease protein
MELVPIIVALKRSKMGAAIIAIQIALTMAMISNIASIAAARTVLFTRPTGTDEQNLFALGYRFINDGGTKGMLEADIRSVLSVPGVVDMVSTNSYPLRGSALTMGVGLTPAENGAQASGGLNTVYKMDAHGITTLGLQLGPVNTIEHF